MFTILNFHFWMTKEAFRFQAFYDQGKALTCDNNVDSLSDCLAQL
jgi:hypothetical protein